MKPFSSFIGSALVLFSCSGIAGEKRDGGLEKQEIQPFSSLRWNDGLLDVVTKLNKVAGLSELQWGVNGTVVKKDVSKISRAEELVQAAPEVYDVTFSSFTNHEGRQVQAPTEGWTTTITAKPVNIGGIPCVLEVSFANEPGFAVTHPEKVISFKTVQGIVTIDAVLAEVQLSSDSPTIPEKLDSLLAAVKEKYPKGVNSEMKDGGERNGNFIATDELGHKLKVSWTVVSGGAELKMEYSHQR
jgi:hypothetical protein